MAFFSIATFCERFLSTYHYHCCW